MEMELRSELLRESFSGFVAKSFEVVDPGASYLHNWHIDLIAEKLQQAVDGKITRLIINVPPRSLKSIIVSVAWPAWILGNDPSAKIMAASYSQVLSLKHSLDCRAVMQSGWYRNAFPEVEIMRGQNEKAKFLTTKRGFRFATSIGGSATGEGGNFLIVDDPHNPLQAASDVMRKNAIDWFDQTFMSRLNDKKRGVVVVVMQRLHIDDLTGHLLEVGGWEHLCLPAIAPRVVKYCYGDLAYIFKAGKTLHGQREGAEELKRAKRELGSYAFAAQYQQDPVLLKGGMVEIDWFGRYFEPPADGRVVQSWDTAIKTGLKNDFSVCTTWLEAKKGYYLLDVLARRMEYPELKRVVVSLAEKWQAISVLIEDKASGQSLLQDLRRDSKIAALPVKAVQDKVSRFAATTAMIESGRVWLPRSAPWLVDYEAEIMSFPNGSHDDMVDSTSQFLNWVRQKRKVRPRVRVL